MFLYTFGTNVIPLWIPVINKCCPLSKKLSDKAYAVFEDLNNEFRCEYDETGSIGKRYRRNDAIGTPFCVTYDFDSENDEAVTVRHRDSMEQERVKIADLKDYIRKELVF